MRRIVLLVLGAWLVVSTTGIVGCTSSDTSSDDAVGTDNRDPQDALELELAELEGLAFELDGVVFVVENGVAQEIARADGVRSLRYSPSGGTIGFLSSEGERDTFHLAESGDWRFEAHWDNQYGSLVDEAVFDDESGVLYFSLKGDASTELRSVGPDGQERVFELSFTPSGEFSLDAEGASLLATGAEQAPTVLRRVDTGSATASSLVAEAARLYAPRPARDGARVCATGSLREEDANALLLIDVMSGEVVDVNTPGVTPLGPVWSPDGTRIAFSDASTGEVWVLDVMSDTLYRTGLTAGAGGLAW